MKSMLDWFNIFLSVNLIKLQFLYVHDNHSKTDFSPLTKYNIWKWVANKQSYKNVMNVNFRRRRSLRHKHRVLWGNGKDISPSTGKGFYFYKIFLFSAIDIIITWITQFRFLLLDPLLNHRPIFQMIQI